MVCFRTKFLSSVSTSQTVSSSPTPANLINRNSHPDLVSQQRSVVNILSEPVSISHLDTAADEIFDIVSRQLNPLEEGTGTLVHFRNVGINR